MGNGLSPGPTNDLGDPIRIDPGTSTRHESPPPGPIGLDAKGGTPKQTQGSMADQIVAFPRNHYGERVGDGECFALAHGALRAAGARSAADYGRITEDGDYVWGTPIALGDVRAGDIVQFRNYEYSWRTDHPDGSGRDEAGGRPHHTAIVERVESNGALTVLEQNAPRGSSVHRTKLYFTSGTFTNGDETLTVTVSGTLWFYRPQAR